MSNRDILKNGLKNLGISVDDKMLMILIFTGKY